LGVGAAFGGHGRGALPGWVMYLSPVGAVHKTVPSGCR
jgi:hypothetical protein